jgi:hypothetical protein
LALVDYKNGELYPRKAMTLVESLDELLGVIMKIQPRYFLVLLFEFISLISPYTAE